jgi:hypothetical protein
VQVFDSGTALQDTYQPPAGMETLAFEWLGCDHNSFFIFSSFRKYNDFFF